VELVRTAGELVEACLVLGPDVVLCAHGREGLDGFAAAADVSKGKAVPFVMVLDAATPSCAARAQATENVVACLARPMEEGLLAVILPLAARRFREAQGLRAEVEDLKRALEERKAVERAKESVARRLHLPGGVAYFRLRSAASSRNRKLADVAAEILAAECVFAGLEVEARPPSFTRVTREAGVLT